MAGGFSRWWAVERALGRGQRRLDAGDAAGAEQAFLEGQGNDPASAPLAWHRAEALVRCERPEDAVASARRALELAGDDAIANLFLGRVLVEVGRPAEAGPPLDRAIALAPTNLVARGWRAIAYLESGETRRGLDLLDGPGIGEDPSLQARLLLAMEAACR